MTVYDYCMQTALSAINPTKKEGIDLVVEVLKTKNGYPSALARAAKIIKFAKDKNIMPLLQETIKHSSPEVRLEAAGTLLSLGDADTALPVLDELAREGNTYAIPYLLRRPGQFWDDRGVEIIKRALNYPQDKINAEAALFLAEMGIEKEKAEEVALRIVEKLKDKTQKDYGLSNEKFIAAPRTERERTAIEQASDDSVGCDYAVNALGVLKSKKAIPVLKYIKGKNMEWFYTCKRGVKEALNEIDKSGDKK